MARSKKAQEAIDGALSIPMPEDQVGLGVDIVSVERMRTILDRTKTFADRMFTEQERSYCEDKPDPAIHFAGRFAAKEAVVKALGCGFSQGVHPRHIEVCANKNGRPEVVLSDAAKEVAEAMGVYDLPLSISHTKDDAIACAIALTYGSKAAEIERKDPVAELARQFKDARKMLEEL